MEHQPLADAYKAFRPKNSQFRCDHEPQRDNGFDRYDQVSGSLGNLVNVPAFKSDEARQEILHRVRTLPTMTIKATEKLNGWPSIALDELLKDDVWSAFMSIAFDIKTKICDLP
ncbi:MAG TPA: hypothetical protein VMV19_10365 [Xanthobacteraceae bacterium]|nr:hypothetical protein [Xanthobacteraceae bacterium]